MSFVKTLEVSEEFYGITTQKGDILVNDGTKNVRLPVGTDGFSLTANSAEPSGLQWNLVETSGSNTIDYSQFLLGNSPWSTNNTNYITIDDFTNTPETGTYVSLFSCTYNISKSSRTVTFGFFKDDILIPNSSRSIEIINAGKRVAFYTQFITSFSGTNEYSVKVQTSDTDTSLTIFDASLLIIKFTNAVQLNIVNIEFSTNSTNPIEINDLSNVPELGVYLVLFNATFETTKNNQTITFGLYKNNSLITGTEKEYETLPNIKTLAQIGIVVSFSGTENANVRMNVSSSNTDGILYDRNLLLIPLS